MPLTKERAGLYYATLSGDPRRDTGVITPSLKPVFGAFATTDRRGVFEILAPADFEERAGAAYCLRVGDALVEDASHFPVELGDKGREFRVGGLGVLVTDLQTLPRALRPLLITRASSREVPGVRAPLRGFRGARRARLPEGLYDLEFLIGARVVGRLEGLLVEAGKECPDTRLAPLRLAPGMEVREVRVLDASGRTLETARVHYLSNKQSGAGVEGWALFPVDRADDGSLRWLHAGDPPLRMAVKAPGYGAQEITGSPSGVTVRLEQELWVDLCIPGVTLESGWRIVVRPHAIPLPVDAAERTVIVDADGHARLPLAPGRAYRAVVYTEPGHRAGYMFEVHDGDMDVIMEPTGRSW
ncbi:MAG: hypothetical protein AAFZ87_07425 [Planctomycetota bacterium]